MLHKLKTKLYGYIPPYAAFPLLITILWNQIVYNGSRLLTGPLFHHDWTSAADRLIPVIPCFISVYFLAFPFWIMGYLLCVRKNETQAMRFLSADFLAKDICLICFICFPTTNVRPVLNGHGFWDILLNWLYRIDAADNLFPSIHCLVSWLCFAGIRHDPSVPLRYRIAILIMAILVFLSTLFTRQHVLADVAGGVIIGELCWQAACHTALPRFYQKFLQNLSGLCRRLIKAIQS